MADVVLETLIDSLKMVPFLFLAYLVIEYIEHKSSGKIEKMLVDSGRLGPVVGAALGCFPQCGFSVAAANFYAGRIITMGTLIAVFLSTSDEAILILISNPDKVNVIGVLILVKVIIAVVAGFVIDMILNNNRQPLNKEHLKDLCTKCDCNHGILKSALRHTLSIFLFIVAVSFLLNTLIYFIKEENLARLFMTGSLFQPFIAALVGFIPNCASSVVITQLYMDNVISFGSVIAGLCTGAGVGIAVLLRVNKNFKENISIIAILYVIGSISGLLIQLMGISL